MNMIRFIRDAVKEIIRGGALYWSWLAITGFFTLVGIFCYALQTKYGMLATTGLSEEISWGIYIANFAFLVGIAAAAVMLVIPAYIFNNEDIKKVVLIGEGMAIVACIMAILFILVSVGRPDRIWHLLPIIGKINLPWSMLAWDVIVINSYLFINILLLTWFLYANYLGREPNKNIYFIGVVLAIMLAVSIHIVTAFLFSSNVSRPYWHTAILGPRFLASAFTTGPALIIIVLQIINAKTKYTVKRKVIETLAIIMTVTLQINMLLLGVEMYTEFYSQTKHASSIQYLFFGLKGYYALVPWIWTSIVLNIIAVIILTIHPLRRRRDFLNTACMLIIVGIWIEKGMGLVIPGFIPTPLGDIVEYVPTVLEIGVMFGIWGFGALLFTLILKISIPIEIGEVRRKFSYSES